MSLESLAHLLNSGGHLLAAKLRRSNIDGSAGTIEELARVVA